MKRKFTSLVMAMVIGLSPGPAFGETVEAVQKPLKPISNSWASSEIVDAERYDIYNKSIYAKSLKEKASQEEIQNILLGLEAKLSSSGLDKKPVENLVEVGDSNTRGGFLRQVYNRIAPYEKKENLEKDPIMHLSHIGILAGAKDGKLFLDRPVTVEETILFSKRAVDYVYNENNVASKGLLWETENKGNTAYFLGSIHMGDSSLYPFSEEVMKRYEKSDELYVEVDISNQEAMMNSMMAFMGREQEEMTYTDDTTLKSVIGDESYNKLKVLMDKFEVGEEVYSKIKPYGVASQLESLALLDELSKKADDKSLTEVEAKEGIESVGNKFSYLVDGVAYGVDLFFLDKAKVDEKGIFELETMDSQFELLLTSPYKKLSKEEQIKKLNEIVENIANPKEGQKLESESGQYAMMATEDSEEGIKMMLETVRSGDEAGLAKIFVDSGAEDMLGGKLIGDRDKKMAEKIAVLLEADGNKTYFIVVGAGHYVTEGMTLDNLRDMGYKIERVK